MIKKIIAFSFFFYTLISVSQNDSIYNRLDEIIINSTKKLQKYSDGQKIINLSDSVITRNLGSFTDLIRYNSSIYLKEYGKGGTSSVSFRGTSASNTAVVWNGININSVNNGQTGFNSLTVNLFDAIDIRSGGGSIEYGSGAIGGTIHLNDILQYNDTFKINNEFIFSGGNYSTFNSIYKSKISDNNYTVSLGISHNFSDNDFKLFNTEFNNTNGNYENYGINLGFGYRFKNNSELKFFSTSYLGERHFSGTLPNPSSANEKYKDTNYRNMLIYGFSSRNINHEIKVAYLTQKYQYFSNKLSEKFNFGKSRRFIGGYSVDLKLPQINATVSSFSEYESTFGSTDMIQEKNRKQFSQYFIYSQNIKKLISFNIKLRKDFNSDYNVPFVYSAGLKIRPFSKFYIRVNGSKNYRVPTYNDLFWPGQGNLDLLPEISLQGEVGVGYKNKKLSIDIGGYYINTEDKIVWTPSGDPNRPGVWVPINLSKTKNKGIEASFNYNLDYKNYKVVTSINYNYTLAKNTRTDKFLTFVPKHLLNSNLTISYKKASLFFQSLFNGKIYTTEENSEDFNVPSFFLLNTGGEYKVFQKLNKSLTLGFKINNLLGKKYVVLPRRPMPERNFNININYKF
ncbi:iron complex outermembrane recepter protein [Tenacibaculum sp. MAR_2010_89]|uniref:TonB-dependent receptor domain-containing protein n=1 Tax=Tenacibaculum sp. MAR_2010_89 TaxID=1250198 RepID=UPI00089C197C|nr:TonB-dependent receptor [Tenacibaculum sp. MAR_2010_89]SEE42365.1 iron complex outermembrane recepter protein [Tenacibaculum sp. MAR_2010_89]